MINKIDMGKEMNSLWQTLAREQLFRVKSDVIWHYTTIESTFGILNTSQLWLSDNRTLNDKNEGILPTSISTNITSDFGPDFNSLIAENAIKRSDEISKYSGSEQRVFLMSFSEKRDLLSQWKGYAHSPFGISLGFNTKKLRDSIEKSGGYIFSVKYEENEYQAFLKLTQANIALTIKSAMNGEKTMSQEHDKMKQLLSAINFVFKSPEWREESEARVIIPSQNKCIPTSYRSKNGSIFPFIPISISPKSLITHAIILDNDPCKRDMLNEFFASNGLKIDVEYSKLQMRF